MFVKQIYKLVLFNHIRKINKILNSFSFDVPEIQEMYDYVISSGRRFRPLLVIAAFEAVGGDKSIKDKLYTVAAAFELLHKASLIHDDMIDKDEFRRAKPTFFSKFSHEKAVIMGDLFIATAFETLDDALQNFDAGTAAKIRKQFFSLFRTLSIGEMKDELFRDKEVKTADVLGMMYQKTAVFIETSLKVGALLGCGNEDELKMLADYGRYVGLAFQIINDMNNINGLEDEAKRKLANDIMNNRKNIVLVDLLNNSDDSDNGKILSILSDKSLEDEEDRIFIIDSIKKYDCLARVEKEVDFNLNNARDAIVGLNDTKVKKLFLKLADEAKSKWFWVDSDL